MGVPWTITLYAGKIEDGKAAIIAAFAEVARLEEILSDYLPNSELCRLSAAAPTAMPVPVSDDLWRVLARSLEIRDMSGGAFDPTIGPLTTLWRQSRRSGHLPQAEKLAAAQAAVGADAILLHPDQKTVSLTRADMRLDLGGIGMGYAIDRAMEILLQCEITAAMIDASGDIAVSNPPPDTAGWSISVAPLGHAPGQFVPGQLLLANAAVTTSGDAFQSLEIEGIRYSHIVDPKTGLGVLGPAAVTVIAGDCTTADALATAASVLGPKQGLAVVAETQECAARFVWVQDGKTRESFTARWPIATKTEDNKL